MSFISTDSFSDEESFRVEECFQVENCITEFKLKGSKNVLDDLKKVQSFFRMKTKEQQLELMYSKKKLKLQ